MDTRGQGSRNVPLAVDLDGTLVSTDLLWEGIFLLLKKNILFVFMLPVWLLSGKAHLRQQVADRVTLDASRLPYRTEFLDFLRGEHASGRALVLVTAAPEPVATAVASELGIFSEVCSTSLAKESSAKSRAELLVERYGRQGFDYAGNDRDDLPVFDAARQAIVVAPDRAAAQFQKRTGCPVFNAGKPTIRTYVRMLRVHQWLKNLLVFVPATLAHDIAKPDVFTAVCLAFVAFSATASAIYIINDIIDLPVDRRHARKNQRPFASGQVSIPFGLGTVAVLLLLTAFICFFLPPAFTLAIVTYLAFTTAYTFALKRMLLGDVICLAGLYSLRLLGGSAASHVPPSFWLMAFAMFFFLSLALVKRYVELDGAMATEIDRIAGRGYRPEDRDIVGQCGVAAAFTAALVLALYINSDSVKTLYTYPWLIWPLGPMVLYMNVRVWILAHRGDMDDDPVLFMAKDWRSQVVIALGAVLLLVAGMR
ncbi:MULTISPECIES: UbiA family prenyltransferase [Brucella/Ochrobactrum group]|uniref:UbiA family prenyltransferase n=1 Tax=Brucella pseudintermedia TaxID=370111 RepID=A0ABY5UKB6_9HYPH|nr:MULTISPECIES: UbiA family prenyltransferase [Brucella/Ochrobactrum group]KAB2683511.1 UbiA family prenyltransferase [Brucella pseudintermedia]MCO7726106.1 UbiA family prenyltransferase [Brucella intermedia]NKE73968.1 UbiA family prenyltransferase [Ochrobactrum sp. MC-1LL]UWL62837.1 UbiA family prenyltransferase [Brucella pseudintermedia]